MSQMPIVRTVPEDAVLERVNGAITRVMQAPPPGTGLREDSCISEGTVYQRVPAAPAGMAWTLGVVTVGPRDLVMHGVFDDPDQAAGYAADVGGELRLVLVRHRPGADGRVLFGDHRHNPQR